MSGRSWVRLPRAARVPAVPVLHDAALVSGPPILVVGVPDRHASARSAGTRLRRARRSMKGILGGEAMPAQAVPDHIQAGIRLARPREVPGRCIFGNMPRA